MRKLLFLTFLFALYLGCAANKEVKPEEPQPAPVTKAEEPAPQPEPVTPPPPPEIKLESIYFDFDRSNIKSEAVEILKKNAEALKGISGIKILVEGNCDERGTNEYNMALGERRANAALEYLINLGVEKTIFKAVSYGEEKPVCTEHNESCWSKNRRVDFIVEK